MLYIVNNGHDLSTDLANVLQAEDNLTVTLIPAAKTAELLSYNSFLQAVNKSFVILEPMYISSQCSFRAKFSVRVNITVPMVVFDIGNGLNNDNIILSVNGTVNAQTVTLAIFRGSVSHAFTSSPISSYGYWLDLIFALDFNGIIKLFNWGQLVSIGNIFLILLIIY